MIDTMIHIRIFDYESSSAEKMIQTPFSQFYVHTLMIIIVA